jgi:arsenate reductase
MAEGLLRHQAGDRFEVFSAGTIASFVRPQAIEVMKEIGIDISHQRSKSQDEFLQDPFDYVITVCDHASQNCPVFPRRTKRVHWSIDDPVGFGSRSEAAELSAFRRARQELQQRILLFLAED